jgi:hypothetical protein
LLQVDPATGDARTVGRGLGFGGVGSLAYDPNRDQLLGSDFLTNQLLLVDRGTGAARSIGKLDIQPRDLAFDPVTDTLYGLVTDGGVGTVYTIDTSTGATRRVAGPFKVGSTNSLEVLHRMGTHVVTVSPGEVVTGQDFGNTRRGIPPARIAAVTPDPRSAAVDRITITFEEPFDLRVEDLRMVRTTDDRVAVPLDSVALTSRDNQRWTVDKLANLTFDSGMYQFMVGEAIETWINRPGDANLDNGFNSSDLVRVFQIGEYEDGLDKNSTWTDGDWNGDGEFGTSDLVTAFQGGGFVAAAISAVPVEFHETARFWRSTPTFQPIRGKKQPHIDDPLTVGFLRVRWAG